jgi:hypothetical protein
MQKYNMTEIITLPDNFIGKEDREKLESFAAHTISRGRATRWHWDKDADGDDIFEIYPVGADKQLFVRISRNRELDAFYARDAAERSIASGTIEHVFAVLESHFARLHGEGPDISA